jgi:large conductance mechanosensitive channel
MSGFKKFILRGNVVDLAVAVVIGASFAAVVQALVKDLITPIIGAFGSVPDFSGVYFTVNNSRFLIGEFINAVVAFVLMALIIYFFVVLPVSTLMERVSPTPPKLATRDCPFCLSKVPEKAVRCAFCTSNLTDEVDAAILRMTQPQATSSNTGSSLVP